MDLLCQIPTKRGVRRALAVLPDGIDKTYSEAWHRLCTQNPQRAELGKRILSWIIHATRPLRIQELRYALAIEDDDEEIDPDGLLDVVTLTSFCAGLVIVDEQRGLFSLVHPTTQEYFDKHKDVMFPAAHEEIAATCITYLQMKPFSDEGALDDFDAFHERRITCHLLGYAAVNWGLHAAMAGSEKAKDDSLSLIKNESVRAAAWQVLQLNIVGAQEFGPEWPREVGDEEECDASKSSSVALHVAAYFGLINIVQIFLELGNDVDQLDGTGRTPLHWAIIGKQNTMLEFLLEHGANANAEIGIGNRYLRRLRMVSVKSLPLAMAAYHDNRTAIECLLHHGAKINRRSRFGLNLTALSVALYYRCRSATQVLLENGADVHVDVEVLATTASNGNLELLKMAVEAGVSNYNIQRALPSAVSASNYNAIVYLVEHGANTNGFSEPLEPRHQTARLAFEEVHTPLVASAAHFSTIEEPESFRCFQYLLDSGADVNCVCARPWYTTNGFISHSHVGASVLLGPKTTALHAAAYFGRLDMVRALVERGADVNLSLGEQHTALSSALSSEGCCEKHIEPSDEFGRASILRVRATINLLVDLGADPQLCKAVEIRRIETLLKMSSDNCKMVTALQTVIDQLADWKYNDCEKESLRDKLSKLKEVVAEGANLDLCCDQDKKKIGEFLAWSKEEIEAMDEERTLFRALVAEYKKALSNA